MPEKTASLRLRASRSKTPRSRRKDRDMGQLV